MTSRTIKLVISGLMFLCGATALVSSQDRSQPADDGAISVPRSWDDEALASMDIPLVNSPHEHAPSTDYYSIPVRHFPKTYPVYAAGKEPPGYMEALRQKEPEEIFDPKTLKTKEDWIRAGEIVFDAPTTFNSHSS